MKYDCALEYEAKIGRYHVDAYSRELNIVFEFQGCAFHECYSCYGAQTTSPICGKSIDTLHQETMAKIKAVKNAQEKPEVIQIWEHTFDADIGKIDSGDAPGHKRCKHCSTLVTSTGLLWK